MVLFPRVGQFSDPAVTGLVRLTCMIILSAVGMFVAATASVSARPEEPPAHEELLGLLASIVKISHF